MHNNYAVLRSLVALIGVLLLSFSQLSQADLDDDIKFDIAPQSMDAALLQFSEQANVQLVVAATSLDGVETQGVTGSLSAETALVTLLGETGLEFSTVGATVTVTIGTAGEGQDSEKYQPASNQTLIAQAEMSAQQSKTTATSATNLSDGKTEAQTSTLEEIIVTARKREENLQDVPIAISIASGESIRAGGIKKLQELAPTMPGLFVNEGVGLDSMHIRGVGSGINFGFEQMVGQVIDGFFYGRSRFSRVQFLDIERVEILKGPQGALIGKNTSAGVINITSAGPTEEFTAWIMPTYEFEGDEGTTVEGAISGPLSDTLKGRFAYRYDDRDGYVENTTSGQGEPAIDDWSGRTTLLWEPSGTIDITARWMRGRFDRNGKTDQLSQCNAFMLGFLAANGVTGEDCTANLTTSVLATKNGVGNFNNSTTTLDTVGVTINWDLGGHTLTSLTGYAQYEYSDEIEGDRSPVEFFSVTMSEDYEQWSQELRLASSLAGRVDYVAGLFYQHTEQVTDFGINLNMASMLGAPSPVGFSTLTITDQKVDSVAVFGQATWHLSDEWGVTLGGRFTSEDKEASQQEFPVLLYTRTPMTVPPPGLPPLNSHNIAQNRTEDNFSPMFDLQWTPNDDIMIYGSIRRGFKGGGFDHMLDASQADADDQFQFEDEDVTAYEIGAKLTLADGAAQLNLASFRNEFEDMQVSALVNTLSGIAVFNVGNAASATTQGFEIDARWRPSKNLTLFGAMAYLDAEYNQYDGAACYAGQTVAQGCVNGVQAMDGKTLPYASEWAGVANAEYVWSLPGDLALIGFVQAVYASEYSLVPNLDPNSWQESNWKYDARLTLTNLASNKWDLSLVGRNLGDEITSSHGDEMPFIFVGSYFRYIDPPRSIAFQGTWRF